MKYVHCSLSTSSGQDSMDIMCSWSIYSHWNKVDHVCAILVTNYLRYFVLYHKTSLNGTAELSQLLSGK